MAGATERDQVGLVVAAALRAGDQVMVLEVFLLPAGDAECEPHDAAPFSRRWTLITVWAYQGPPLGVGTLRSLSSRAMALADFPASSLRTGFSARARALASLRVWMPLALRPLSLTP